MRQSSPHEALQKDPIRILEFDETGDTSMGFPLGRIARKETQPGDEKNK